MATEINIGLLSTQNISDGYYPFNIICARPQSTNEALDNYNNLILRCVDDIPNVYCVSITFNGLAKERNLICCNLISFVIF